MSDFRAGAVIRGFRSLVFVLGDVVSSAGRHAHSQVEIGRRRRGLTLSIGLFLKTRGLFFFGFRNVVDAFLLGTTDEKRRDGLYSAKESLPRPLVLHT